jgi:2-keto-4-pentenoate hydratase
MYKHSLQLYPLGRESEIRRSDPFTLAAFAEPEIVFRLAAAPSPHMDEAALFGCIDWVAQGFEIVQSVFPGWKFAPADTVIVNGLHGALLLAPRPSGWLRQLHRLGVQSRWFRDRAVAR